MLAVWRKASSFRSGQRRRRQPGYSRSRAIWRIDAIGVSAAGAQFGCRKSKRNSKWTRRRCHQMTRGSRRRSGRRAFGRRWRSCSSDQLHCDFSCRIFEERAHAEIARTFTNTAGDGEIATAAGDETAAPPLGWRAMTIQTITPDEAKSLVTYKGRRPRFRPACCDRHAFEGLREVPRMGAFDGAGQRRAARRTRRPPRWSGRALALALARLDQPPPPPTTSPAAASELGYTASLSCRISSRTYRFGAWQKIAPRVLSLRRYRAARTEPDASVFAEIRARSAECCGIRIPRWK